MDSCFFGKLTALEQRQLDDAFHPERQTITDKFRSIKADTMADMRYQWWRTKNTLQRIPSWINNRNSKF
ncbi:hypothetical protein CkaCkLH20_03740 [Colletotrichum karsti]|uniref:Uncharacterized protein n=1 Tax=Colletotrichum karsti TaxID=1095194 RepID=A0A9P6IA91_9PEZI|nr:uncharacterized protein CkaCkLH20_03740 [Colletotrichum karsti]KAF9878840.1 hypothetical protein CkaCkLH20_03740 [Colletotrichum karsti]